MIYIGIDVGVKGGISYIKTGLEKVDIKIFPMQPTERGVVGIFESIKDDAFHLEYDEKVKAIIEAVHAFKGQGVVSMFTFGRNYGFLRGCLVSLGIPFEEVQPKKWQLYFGLSKHKDEAKTDYKKRILQVAQNMFPNTSVALQTADSLLLAEYLRRINLKEK